MASASAFSSLDDHDYRFSSRRGPPVEVGGVAAASGRRADFHGKLRAAEAKEDGRRWRPGPWAWVFAGLSAWSLLIGGRMQIARLVPPAAQLYSALGFDVNLRRMAIENVVSSLADEDGRPVLVVEGEIRNLAASPHATPRMRLSVVDADGREIYHWTAAPPKARLAAGEKAEFRARLAVPPKEGHQVRVRFAAQADSSGSER
ncbi:DUF3426 domain-containing protein [Rhodoblastus sp.]|uniref:DUF3426 domain-containing protein n=1 Tax=Rhodoblastus sp. TaxID=1962975 RepID=UPI002624ABB6|nr:DUF3426 domain-containing protein [Rhodoblastus sp.]